MKVLIVTPAIGIVYGGTSKSVLELAQSLGDLGVDVNLVTTNANGATTLKVPLQTWIKEKSYCIQYFSYFGLNDYKFSVSLARWLFSHVCDYDIVHTNAIFSPSILPAYWACQWFKIPYLVTPHGMLEPWALSYKARKKRFYYSLLEKPAINKASVIQMVSSIEAERAKSLNLQPPLVIIPNGLHKGEFESLANPQIFYEHFPRTQDKILILFLARIHPKKGLDLLATAFGKVHSQFPNTHLVIAGADNLGFLPTAKNYFVEQHCLDAVTFTGLLTGEVKKAALSAASIYVAPSYSEGFSISVLEGMASGLPCIITTGCNFPEAEQAQAAKVVDINSEAIADSIYWCLSHSEEAKQLGNHARQFILSNYTWGRIANQLADVYQKILDNRSLTK